MILGYQGFLYWKRWGGWGESLHQPKIYVLPPTPTPPPPRPKVNLPPPPLATKFFFPIRAFFHGH